MVGLSKKERKTKKSNHRKLVFAGMFAIALLLLAIAISRTGGAGSNTTTTLPGQQCKQVPYSDEECKEIPYTDQEEYYEQECQQVPYTDRVCENKDLVYAKDFDYCRKAGLLQDWAETKCTIINHDDEGGTFTIWIGFETRDGNKVGQTKTIYVYPHSSNSVEYSQKMSFEYCQCLVQKVPTKQVCRDVTKYRQECEQVIRYRPVTKYRKECTTVTKYREECS